MVSAAPARLMPRRKSKSGLGPPRAFARAAGVPFPFACEAFAESNNAMTRSRSAFRFRAASICAAWSERAFLRAGSADVSISWSSSARLVIAASGSAAWIETTDTRAKTAAQGTRSDRLYIAMVSGSSGKRPPASSGDQRHPRVADEMPGSRVQDLQPCIRHVRSFRGLRREPTKHTLEAAV